MPRITRQIAVVLAILSSFSILKGQPDSLRIQKILDFVNKNRQDSVVAFDSLKQADFLARQTGNPLQMGLVEVNYGILYYLYQDHKNSRTWYEKALSHFQKVKDTALIAKTERLIGIHYDVTGDLNSARTHISRALDLYRAIDQKSGIGECYLSMAVLLHRTHKYSESLTAFVSALQIAKEENRPQLYVANIYNNIGIVYHEMGFMDSARYYKELTIHIKEEENDVFGLPSSYHNLATLEYDEGNFLKALRLYQKAQTLRRKAPMNDEYITGLLCIGRTHIRVGNYDSARTHLVEAQKHAEELELLQREYEAHWFLSELEEALGNYKAAYEELTIFKTLSDTASALRHELALSELEAKFSYQLQVEENEKLKLAQAENQSLLNRNRQVLKVLIVVLFLLALVLMIAIISLLRLRNNKKELEVLNEKLSDQTSQLRHNNTQMSRMMHDKNDLVSVMAHDLRTPFTRMYSIADLIRYSEGEEERAGFLQMLENVSRDGLGLIQDLIDFSRLDEYHEGGKNEDRAQAFRVKDVLDRIALSFRSSLASKNLKLEMDLCEESVVSREDFCERICDNLLSNAIKYSHPEGIISVKAYCRENKMVIDIRDNGPGFKEEDMDRLFTRFSRLSARPTGVENSTGLGLYIAKQLALAIGGDIELISKAGEPACFRFYFSMNSKA